MGGMESVAVNFISRTRHRYVHRVISLRGEGTLARRVQAMGIHVVSLDKQPGKDLRAYWRLRRILLNLKPDLVHTYNVGTVDVAFWARLAGVRHVVHAEHGRDASDPTGASLRYRLLRRLMAPAVDRFVAVSNELGAWLTRDVGLPAARVQVIRNGIDPARVANGAAVTPWTGDFGGPNALMIGSVGRLDPVKGFDVLIEAFARLHRRRPDTNARLVIVGDGREHERLTAIIARHGLAPYVRLTGALDDIGAVLRSIDIYACASLTEGIALTILEAMACERPVVATRVGGNPELVTDRVTGLLVPARDPESLTCALEKLADDRLLARRLGQAGGARVRADFGLESMTDAYCRLYDDVMGIGGPAASVEHTVTRG